MAEPNALARLKAYLEKNEERPSTFAIRAGLLTSTFFHILSGRRLPGRDNSFKIDAATNGEVPAELWGGKAPTPKAVKKPARRQSAA